MKHFMNTYKHASKQLLLYYAYFVIVHYSALLKWSSTWYFITDQQQQAPLLQENKLKVLGMYLHREGKLPHQGLQHQIKPHR